MLIIPKNFEKIINASGKVIHSPEQRLILGVTALATQPFIDLNNKKADEDTRILSTCRTIAKIIAGTTSGIAIRALCIKIANKLSKEGQILDPVKLINKMAETETSTLKKGNLKALVSGTSAKLEKSLKNYNNTIGTASAIGVMLLTNFLWDAPVAKRLTNFFYDKASKKETK